MLVYIVFVYIVFVYVFVYIVFVYAAHCFLTCPVIGFMAGVRDLSS